MFNTNNILIVEDDVDLVNLTAFALIKEGVGAVYTDAVGERQTRPKYAFPEFSYSGNLYKHLIDWLFLIERTKEKRAKMYRQSIMPELSIVDESLDSDLNRTLNKKIGNYG